MKNRQPTTDNRSNKSMKGDELADRLLDFAVRIIGVAAALPKNPAGRHIAGQIVDCGTSVGAHYEEARGAESKADFLHKLGIALKECRETRFWLRVIDRARLLSGDSLGGLLVEADELCAILGQSILTAKGATK
jgi:four helix bundle protein